MFAPCITENYICSCIISTMIRFFAAEYNAYYLIEVTNAWTQM